MVIGHGLRAKRSKSGANVEGTDHAPLQPENQWCRVRVSSDRQGYDGAIGARAELHACFVVRDNNGPLFAVYAARRLMSALGMAVSLINPKDRG